MKGERHMAGKRGHKPLQTDKRKMLLIGVTAVMVLFAMASAFFVIRSFLTVKEFELSGVTQYDRSEIAVASGIRMGDRIYSLDLDAAEKALLEACPYIASVEIERRLSGKVIFRVEERMAMWYIAVSGDYYALDSTLTVIEETANLEKLEAAKVTRLVLPDLRRLICGEVPGFGKDDMEVLKTLELISEVQGDPLKSRITYVDVESRFNVNITIDGIYDVYLGDISNVSEKLRVVRELLLSGDLEGAKSADIDVSIPETMVVKLKFE